MRPARETGPWARPGNGGSAGDAVGKATGG